MYFVVFCEQYVRAPRGVGKYMQIVIPGASFNWGINVDELFSFRLIASRSQTHRGRHLCIANYNNKSEHEEIKLNFLVFTKTALNAILGQSIRDLHRPIYKGSFSIDCRERGSHARCVYPTQYTSRMGTARAKREEEADTRIITRA